MNRARIWLELHSSLTGIYFSLLLLTLTGDQSTSYLFYNIIQNVFLYIHWSHSLIYINLLIIYSVVMVTLHNKLFWPFWVRSNFFLNKLTAIVSLLYTLSDLRGSWTCINVAISQKQNVIKRTGKVWWI